MKNKPLIGSHVSIAGGIQNAPLRARDELCETFQCFTRSPQGGPAPKLTNELVADFRNNMKLAGIDRFYIHAPYYINLASLDNRISQSSVKVIREELERGTVLGAKYLMFHPGSYTNQTLEEALDKTKRGLREILGDYSGSCQLLIEISAGAGNVLGDTFEELAELVKGAQDMGGLGGICFDTCHAFASSYDYRTTAGSTKMLQDFDKIIGLKWLRLSHVQDSKVDLGTHKDRHEHIGHGFIGQKGLESLLKTSEFGQIDWILETESENRAQDVAILKEIRG